MDYLSIVTMDQDFMTILWAGVLPFVIVGDLKWAGAWIVTWFLAFGLEATWGWQIFWIILIAAYANSKMIGMLSAVMDEGSQNA